MGDRETRDLNKYLLRSPQKTKKQHPQSHHRVWTPAAATVTAEENEEITGIQPLDDPPPSQQHPRSYNYYHNPANPYHSSPAYDDPDNVYHQISLMNGQINRMDLSQMKVGRWKSSLHDDVRIIRKK